MHLNFYTRYDNTGNLLPANRMMQVIFFMRTSYCAESYPFDRDNASNFPTQIGYCTQFSLLKQDVAT